MLLRRDDRVLISTRVPALVISPFLLGAFVILYGFPRHTARLFAWPIKPTMTVSHAENERVRRRGIRTLLEEKDSTSLLLLTTSGGSVTTPVANRGQGALR